MASAAHAALESLLRERRLDVTLTSSAPWREVDAARLAPTGHAVLDAALGGGLRRGHLSEVVGARSTGRTTLLCQVLAAATTRGEVVALIDPLDRFDPASGAAAGIGLARLLWVRDHGTGDQQCTPRALKAMNLVLQAGGFGIVALDLADVPAATLRQIPATTWMRLSRTIEGSQTVALLIGNDRIARSPGGSTIVAEPPRVRWTGRSEPARLLRGLDLQPKVLGAGVRVTR